MVSISVDKSIQKLKMAPPQVDGGIGPLRLPFIGTSFIKIKLVIMLNSKLVEDS